MKSNLLFAAENKANKNELLLATMMMKAVHKMHRPGTRIEDTANEVLSIVAKGNRIPPSQAH